MLTLRIADSCSAENQNEEKITTGLIPDFQNWHFELLITDKEGNARKKQKSEALYQTPNTKSLTDC